MASDPPETLRLAAGPLSAEIVPSIGGGVARFDISGGGGVTDIFRPWPEGGSRDPETFGMFVLAPWSNRVSGGGFSFAGAFHPLPPTVAGRALPLHGDAWQVPWSVVEHDAGHLRLTRETEGLGPFHYRGDLEYALSPGGLSARLTLTNLGGQPLPFGAGFHPWFRRTPGVRLQAPARQVWLENAQHMPDKQVPVAQRREWDFAEARPLPAGWINNAFTGWNRKATIVWEDRGLALDIECPPPLDICHVYSPGSDAPFFCLEPVTHAVDAHNLAPGPEAHGLVVLAPGEALTIACDFNVREIG